MGIRIIIMVIEKSVISVTFVLAKSGGDGGKAALARALQGGLPAARPEREAPVPLSA